MGFTSFAYQSQNEPVTAGLVLYYDVNNASSYPGSGTNLTDLSVSALNSTLTNGPTYSSSNGGTITFDGTNDYATRANNAIFDFGTGDFAIETWVKINGNASLNNSGTRDATLITCFPTAGGITAAWGLQINGTSSTTGTGLLFQKYGGGTQNATLNYTFTQGQFYQIGVTHLGGITRFFINGVLYAASTNLSGGVNSGGYPFNIAGLRYAGYLQYFNGTVGITRIYKGKGLNAAEVQQNYLSAYRRQDSGNIVIVPTSGLLLYLDGGNAQSYPGSGTIWYDLSPERNNATLTNGPIYDTTNNGYFVFDGSNDYVDFLSETNIPSGNPQYTILVWHKPAVISGGNLGLLGWGTYGTNFQANAFRTIGDAYINFWWSRDLTSSTLSMSANNWYMAAATYNGTTRTIYHNAVSKGSDNPSTTSRNITTTNNLRVASTNNAEYYNGGIGFVLLYNNALSSTQITEIFNQTKSRYGY
jgi:hypothetical protein